MPETLLQFDRHLFYFINHDMANAFFDLVMPYLRNPKFWIPLYIFIIAFCLWRYKKTGVVIIVLLALTAGFANFTSDTLIKQSVQRVRPCRDPITAKTDIIRVGCGTGYSFPSIHATDHFAMAAFLVLVFYKKWRWIALWAPLWAIIICFAQVYVGVHYPLDVISGAIFGTLIGSLFTLIFKKLQPQF
jgi:membrane-associated phospholipid phosphatase